MHRRTFLAATTAATAAQVLPLNAFAKGAANPLLAPWSGPFGGTPPFDKVRVEQFKPALEAAMAEELREIDAIANNPAPPTFENTIAALERSGAWMNAYRAQETFDDRPPPLECSKEVRRGEGHVEKEADRRVRQLLTHQPGNEHQLVVLNPDPIARP